MTPDAIHLRTVYHLPSFQGGDTEQPLCLKPPKTGVTARPSIGWAMTNDADQVNCEMCLRAMRRRAGRAA